MDYCVAGDDAPATHAELAAFVRDHFLKDQQLAKLHPAGSKAYWVSSQKRAGSPSLLRLSDGASYTTANGCWGVVIQQSGSTSRRMVGS
jgi:hypothetical protein